tara:strand:+ start:410983 stop:411366 length:384 start_codon:yes stop_codon:yes gene_type:complete
MLQVYKYIYFRVYSWNNYLWKNNQPAVFNTTLAVTLSFVAFILFIDFLIEKFFKVTFLLLFKNLYLSIGFTFVVFIIHYFLFEYRNKYLKIEEEFKSERENKTQWLIKGFLVFLYALGPILLFIIFG